MEKTLKFSLNAKGHPHLALARKCPALHEIPEGRNKECWHSWRDGTGTVPTPGPSPGGAAGLAEMQDHSLHFPSCICFLFSCRFGRPSSVRRDGQVQVEHPVLGIVLFEVLKKTGSTLLNLPDNPKLGGGMKVLQGRAAPQGDSEEPAETPQGQVQSAAPSPAAPVEEPQLRVTAALRNTPAAHTAPPCILSILTRAQT